MPQTCVNCGTEYDHQASQTHLEICPTCTNTVYQNMAHDMTYGGSWTGMTGMEELSSQTPTDHLQ